MKLTLQAKSKDNKCTKKFVSKEKTIMCVRRGEPQFSFSRICLSYIGFVKINKRGLQPNN